MTNKRQEIQGTGIDTESILEENKLQLVETGFFRRKQNIMKVRDKDDNSLILKTGRIEKFQTSLFEVARAIEEKLSFRVPAIIQQGEGWILLEEIEGKLLNDFYGEKPEWYVEVSKKIADDYQLVIQEVQKTLALGDLLSEGKEWFLSRLETWGRPIVDAGLIDTALLEKIKKDFDEVTAKNGEDFFGWFHGNIIGDHIIVSGENLYLLDLDAVPRPGRGYYDFLRALDFMLLKEEGGTAADQIPQWIRRCLSDFNEYEVRLVFALRNIGILGWDILHEKVEYVRGGIEMKKRQALKFIKREY